ncbi:MAG: aconitate hydratase, partial [Oscillospiraceae bacterium]|nr:aconitate hydratase [Oscillospiraceae bacterium]
NAGIVPLTFEDENDYDRIDQMDNLSLPNISEEIRDGQTVTVKDETKGFTFHAKAPLTDRQRSMILVGGLLNYTKQQAK